MLMMMMMTMMMMMMIAQGRLCAAQACTQWARVFWSTGVWSHLGVAGTTMCSWQWCMLKRDYEVRFYPL